jgi:Domain of unknown function (DUF4388)
MHRTLMDSSGRVALPQPAVREIGAQPLELVSFSSRHLLFTVPGSKDALTFAGLLGDLGVADLLSFINMFRKSGILRFELPGGNKELYFQQGELIFATSSYPEEDLGEILFDLGKLDAAQLQKARRFAGPRAGFGKFLVEKGVVGPKDLWQASRNQIEAIVYNLFTEHCGGFSFLARELERDELLRVQLSTQNLIMEGLRRVDERALFMRRIGSLDGRPRLTEKSAEGLSPAHARLLLTLGEEGISAREALRRSGVGEFEGLRLLYQLLERGVVQMEVPPSEPVQGVLGEILSIYNGTLVLLYKRMIERNPGFAQEVRLFLRDLPQPFSFVFREVGVREDGSVDGGRILANLAGLEEGDKQRLLAEALNELLYMVCNAARRDLGAGESADMLQRVQEIGRRIKSLIGRSS